MEPVPFFPFRSVQRRSWVRVEQPQCAGGKPPAVDAASVPILPDIVTTLNGREPMTLQKPVNIEYSHEFMNVQVGHTPVRWRPRAAPVSPVEMSPTPWTVDKDTSASASANSPEPVRGSSRGISQTPHRNSSPPPRQHTSGGWSAGEPVATDARAEEEVVDEESTKERPRHIAEIQRLVADGRLDARY